MNIYMSMDEIKRQIVKAFRQEYGFAPAMKNIIPLESSGCGEKYDWMAFCIGRIGYTYSVIEGLEKSEVYNLN